ncbi:hypothetical protein HID58_094323, partial [Brassica napus]
VSWSLLILVLREKGNQSRLPIEMDKIDDTKKANDWQLANSSLIQCYRQMGHSRANVIVLATSEKLLSVSIFYIANAAFVLA